ncbi:hypothetical protein Tcan_14382 [Toxocara canis]|uniref:Uncharacterized protein n=1 Tax=Toxocara canis TaxID=6265 RepID=A0A0B2VZY7_TOXCA|nr:hypothetical protein Tcan_14382 [Toxocara canis]
MQPSEEQSPAYEEHEYTPEQISYIIESAIYALAMILGFGACVYTARSTYPESLLLMRAAASEAQQI